MIKPFSLFFATIALAFHDLCKSIGLAAPLYLSFANEFARNVQDALLNPVAFALPASASSSTSSAVIDLGLDTFKAGNFELDLAIPALSTTIAPDTRTVTAIIETSDVSNFASVNSTIFSKVLTGSGGAGIPAQSSLRCRIPSNCPRYVRATITFGASTTTGAAVSASLTPRF